MTLTPLDFAAHPLCAVFVPAYRKCTRRNPLTSSDFPITSVQMHETASGFTDSVFRSRGGGSHWDANLTDFPSPKLIFFRLLLAKQAGFSMEAF